MADLGEAVLTLKVDGKEYRYELNAAKGQAKELDDQHKKTEKSTRDLGKTFTDIAGIVAAVAAVASVLYNAWAKDEAAAVRLNSALKIAGLGFSTLNQELQDYAKQLQLSSGQDEENIKNQMAQAVLMGRSVEEIKKLAYAATNLASAGIAPLDAAFEALAVTYDGLQPRNKVMKAMIGELTEAQLKNGEAVDIITGKVAGMNEAMMNTASGGLTAMKNALGEVAEAFGRAIAEIVGSSSKNLAGLMNEMANNLNKTLDMHQATEALENGTATLSQKLLIINDQIEKQISEIDGLFKGAQESAKIWGEKEAQKQFDIATGPMRKRLNAMEEIRNGLNAEVEAEKKASEVISAKAAVEKKAAEERAAAAKAAEEAAKKELAWQEELAAMEAKRAADGAMTTERYLALQADIERSRRQAIKSEQDAAQAQMDYLKSLAGETVFLAVSTAEQQEQAAKAAAEANKKAAEDSAKAWRKGAQDILNVIQQFSNQVGAIFNQITANQLAEIDAWYAAEKQNIENTITDEDAKKEKLAELDKEYSKKKYKAELDAFNTNKAMQVANIAINTASAIVKAFVDMPFWVALGVSTAIGLLGAAQAGLVLAQAPPPAPAFAQGGSFDVPPGYPNDSFGMRVQSGEHVAVTPAGEDAGMPALIQFVMSDKVVGEVITRITRDKQTRIYAGAIVS
jgi:hypothetical protein